MTHPDQPAGAQGATMLAIANAIDPPSPTIGVGNFDEMRMRRHMANDIRAAAEALSSASVVRGEPLLRPASSGPAPGCYCKPGKCMAPVVMGEQMPCRDPAKAAQGGVERSASPEAPTPPQLLACPFCGGTGRIVAADEAGPDAYVVCCRKCQASSPVVYALKEGAEQKLVEAWNRRVGDSQRADAAERLLRKCMNERAQEFKRANDAENRRAPLPSAGEGKYVEPPLVKNLRDTAMHAMKRNNAWEWGLHNDAAAEIERLARENAALNKALDGEEERVSASKGRTVQELERLILRIEGLTLPSYTSQDEVHRDRVSRAGVCTEIRCRIDELRGKTTSDLSAADAFIGAGQMIASKESGT